MIGFRKFIESSLRDQLNVPQNPRHHPEGNVDRHTLMVRTAMPNAIAILKQKKAKDPNGPFSNLDLNFSDSDINLLRMSALMHDVGKGNALNPDTLSAHGHEDEAKFEPAMRQLGPVWQNMFKKATLQDKEDLFFIIKHHMSLHDELGIQSRNKYIHLIDKDGKYKNERKVKLLLCIFLMDRMGRGGPSNASRLDSKNFVKSNLAPGTTRVDALYKTSGTALDQWRKEKGSEAAPNSPEAFISLLRDRGQPDDVIKKALRGKRLDLSPEEIDSYLAK